MTRLRKSLAASAAAIAVTVMLAAPGLADMGAGMMGPGMMIPGMTGPAITGPGMMGTGMMGPGTMGSGSMGSGFGDRVTPNKELTTNDVRHFLEHRLEEQGNKRLKLGSVKQTDDDTIVAEITTVDGSLVERLEVDRHTGQMKQID